MPRFLTADYLYTVHTEPIENGVIEVSESGEILNVFNNPPEGLSPERLEYYSGALTPGFVNAHCHLELSHLKGRIEKHTGLVPFLLKVMSNQPEQVERIQEAMKAADAAMHKSGIVAVGDVSNHLLSKEVKLNSPIHYHTFIELIGAQAKQAKGSYEKGVELLQSFQPLSSSLVPHAPYSVSRELFTLLKTHQTGAKWYSMHNQESEAEKKWFENKSGAFTDFYQAIKRNMEEFQPSNQSSLKTVLPWLPPEKKILLVHNTYCEESDLVQAAQSNLDIFWCLCPNANLYIENALPKIERIKKHSSSIVLGTDSLASNDRLCMLEEIKTLLQYFPELTLQETLTWATAKGAEYFEITSKYGTIETGKSPGVNLITHLKDQKTTKESKVIKII